MEVSTHIWAQAPKLILKGKAVDPLEQGGAMEAGWSKLEGKQALDGNQGGNGGEKGNKKEEKKEKKEKKIERVAKGSDGGQKSQAAPSLGPGPSPSKKAKASVSKSRLKRPSVSQNAKFTNDVGVTPSGSIKASALELITTPVNPLLDPQPRPSSDPTDQIIKALEVCINSLEKQVERIPDLELQLSSMSWVIEALWEQVQGQLATHSFPTSSHRSLPLPLSVSRQMQRLQLEMVNSHPKSDFLTLEAEGQPSSHLGLQLVSTSADGDVEMEDDASGEGSSDDAEPPLPIPPPFTDLVLPIESFSSKPDMELEDVDME
ncbi:hypothetical protein PAXRUDRAFT_18181 [Paxillus rubicundulus Ve08.2h10]|uniref:Uncharacterized protein n=1 Tax=Paxillus rubicundulus Ve08.2h10 TaxID=930991 RepID=A0A0D0D842_9AGAM|nr:hypothetical protein PAXRUDRAFT_18181 [Paxillus rubicundulus Ve08.2h10]